MARRPGLGKGLYALIPNKDEKGANRNTSGSAAAVLQVPIEAIQPNPQQPRSKIDKSDLEDLAASINEHGIIQPLIVSEDPNSGTFFLIAGERRWRLIENLQRTDLTPLEMAEAYRQLADNFSLTHDQIAERVGKSRTSVTNTLRLLNLPDQVQNALAEGLISEGHARALLGLPSNKAQRAALSTVLNLGLNVRQTEALIKKLNGERPQRKAKPQTSPEARAMENKLRNFLETKVSLNESKNGGHLVIYYYSDEELNTILDKILPDK